MLGLISILGGVVLAENTAVLRDRSTPHEAKRNSQTSLSGFGEMKQMGNRVLVRRVDLKQDKSEISRGTAPGEGYLPNTAPGHYTAPGHVHAILMADDGFRQSTSDANEKVAEATEKGKENFFSCRNFPCRLERRLEKLLVVCCSALALGIYRYREQARARAEALNEALRKAKRGLQLAVRSGLLASHNEDANIISKSVQERTTLTDPQLLRGVPLRTILANFGAQLHPTGAFLNLV